MTTTNKEDWELLLEEMEEHYGEGYPKLRTAIKSLLSTQEEKIRKEEREKSVIKANLAINNLLNELQN